TGKKRQDALDRWLTTSPRSWRRAIRRKAEEIIDAWLTSSPSNVEDINTAAEPKFAFDRPLVLGHAGGDSIDVGLAGRDRIQLNASELQKIIEFGLWKGIILERDVHGAIGRATTQRYESTGR